MGNDAVYRAARERIIELVGTLSPDQLRAQVPGTPAWAVHDVLAHLAGVATDVRTGNLEGAATEPWTARQVGDRRDRSVAELLAEWDQSAPDVLAVVEKTPAFAIDSFVHEHDLRGAVGLAAPSDPDVMQAMVGRVVRAAQGPRVDGQGLPALRLVAGPSSWVAGTGDVGATVTASAAEFFRSLFGRRSVAQVRAYSWEGDPTPYLDIFNLFGPLPEDDVVEAGAP